MKHNTLLRTIAVGICAMLCTQKLYGQVGINTTTPDANSVLDIVSNTKGVLIPRLNQTEVNTLAALIPADGTLVYNATSKCVQIFRRTSSTAGTFDCLVISSDVDTTKDAWVDDSTNKIVKLASKTDGTARSTTDDVRITDSGNMGIGIATPKSKLDLRGYLKLYTADTTADDAGIAAADRAGMIRYYSGGSTSKWLQYHDGTDWRSLKPVETTHDLLDGYVDSNNNFGLGGYRNGTFTYKPLRSLTTAGIENMALGHYALDLNTSGSRNIAIGANALDENTTGGQNTALGGETLNSNTTGNFNTGIGRYSLSTATTGNNNTALGYRAGDNLTTGSDNLFLGNETGKGLTTGSGNTIIGSIKTSSASNQLPADMSNSIILADGAGNTRFYADNVGSVGIGTGRPFATATNPLVPLKSQLVVNGYVKLGTTDAVANAATAADRTGMIRYNTTSKALQYHDDVDWKSVASTATADLTNDAWVNDNPNTQVKLGTKSDGTTARDANTDFVIKDDGRVGIGTASPAARLDVQTGNVANFLRMANFLAPSNTTAGSASQISLGTSSSTKNEAQLRFVHQASGADNNRFDIGWNGVTAPTVSIMAGGNVGIGTASPSAALEVNGTVEIASPNTVPNNTAYRPLVWNTSTNRVETSFTNSDHVSLNTAEVTTGSTTAVYTLSVNGSGAYDIKIKVSNQCGSTSYNRFVAAGGNSGNKWRINFTGGVSENGNPTKDASSTGTNLVMLNPIAATCGTTGVSSLNYTLSINSGTGALSITNNSGGSLVYEVVVEKAFD